MSQNFYNKLVYENPFTQCTGRDMSYREVLDFWCDPFRSLGLNESDLFASKTPIIFEGARGTGKTMILKYLSYYCQKEYAASDILEYFRSKRSIGIYFRYKLDFVNFFAPLNLPDEVKQSLFLYYFELIISLEILDVLNDILSTSTVAEGEISQLIYDLSEFFCISKSSIVQVIEHINIEIEKLDTWMRSYRYRDNSQEELLNLIKTNVIRSIVFMIGKDIAEIKDVVFMIIIDEYENAKIYQKIINTLVKKVDDTVNITYRIGMRTEGMLTYSTLFDETLQANRDFLLVPLVFESNNLYKNFLRLISQRRLESTYFYRLNGLTSIEKLLGKKEDLIGEAKDVISSSSYKKKHFELLKKAIPASEFDSAIRVLSSENPLLEMLNVLWVLRGVPVDSTAKAMKDYESGKSSKTSKYRRDYVDKYKYQLAFLLLNIYKGNQKIKKCYYSFNTFAFLSSGSVNDFISLCRYTFYLLDENYYVDICNNPIIPKEIQTNGAAKTAIEQLGNIEKNDEFGTQMHTFVMNVGNMFSEYHKDICAKYPETNQFAFDNEASIDYSTHLKLVLKSLLKWGAIIKKRNPQRISLGKSKKGSVYFLNHIFAPVFNISYRIRGGYNPLLSIGLFERMLYESLDYKEISKLIVAPKRIVRSKTPLSTKEKVVFEQIDFLEDLTHE